jgi:hypothetical protein
MKLKNIVISVNYDNGVQINHTVLVDRCNINVSSPISQILGDMPAPIPDFKLELDGALVKTEFKHGETDSAGT